MAGDDSRKPNGTDDPNVVSLADVRKRQRTVRADKEAARKGDGRAGAYAGPGKAGGHKGGKQLSPWAQKVFQYAQFILFLVVVAYMLKLCQP